jgi:mRNA interferase MazF
MGSAIRKRAMVMKKFIPERGDFISVTFDPQSGHEQKGRRPALVISSRFF